MSFSPFALTKTWESAEDFPTYEDDELQVRADMQCLFTELADGINALIAELAKHSTNDASAGANNIGVDAIAGMTNVTDVQSALAYLKLLIDNLVIGQLGDDSIATNMIQALAVTTAKIALGAVNTSQLADGAVTGAKTNFNGGLTIGGKLNINDQIILDSDSYGDTLPAAGTPGRLFFLKAT